MHALSRSTGSLLLAAAVLASGAACQDAPGRQEAPVPGGSATPAATPAPRDAPQPLPPLPMPSRPARDAGNFQGLGSASREELLARVGPPDARFATEGEETWLYRRFARGNLGSEGYPEVRLVGGRVVQITFHPTEESLLQRFEGQ